MSPAAPPLIDDVNEELVRARIDTQDKEFAAPIREFLEEFGCQVVTHGTPDPLAVYHVICGDWDFVKELLEREPPTHQKRLAIIWNGNDWDLNGYDQRETRVVLTDPKPLSGTAVTSIFSFFFTSAARVLDLRTWAPGARPQPAPLPVLIEEPRPDLPRAVADEDKKRIQSMVTAMFAGGDTKKRERRKKRQGTSWVAAVAAVVALIAVPFVWYGAAVSGAGLSFATAATFLAQGKSKPAGWTIAVGQALARQSRTAVAVAGLPFRLVGAGDRLRVWERLVSLLSDVGAGLEELLAVTADANALARAMLGGQGTGTAGKAPAVRLSAIRRAVSSVVNHLGLAQAQLDQVLADPSFPFSWAGVQSVGRRAGASLSRVRQQVALVDNLLTIYPSLAGFDRKKTYLLLFQNSAELRPTGGFIGSLAVISAENGIVGDLAVMDVYSTDGQLKGHVDPPQPIRELLAQEHWYLRDSNWDPDFRVSGRQAAWFYEKEAGVAVDGVVAITTGLVSDLLRATGPLDLPDYPDRITADNFLGKAIFYTQSDFFPGSTQKKDFLGAVTRALLTSIMSGKRAETMVVAAIARGLVRRDIQLFMVDSELEAILEHFGWSGRVFGTEGCAGQTSLYCLFDPLAVIEANMSVNKANAFIKRERVRQVVLGEDGTVAQTLTLSYTNSSLGPPQDAGGSYRAYLQFILPPDATDISVTVGASLVPERTNVRRGARVPYWERAGAGRIGVAIDVPTGGQTTASFSYRRSNPLVFGRDGAIYELYDQKQAGVTDETLRTIIRYPIFWQATQGGQEGQEGKEAFLAKEAQLEYNTPVPGDRFMRVRLSK